MYIQMQLQMAIIQLSLHVTHFSRFFHLVFAYFPHFLHHIFIVDPPTVRLLGAPQIDLEEGKDSLVLRCEADANPPASIIWKRAGRSEIQSLQVSKMLNESAVFTLIHSSLFCVDINLLMPFPHNEMAKIQFDRKLTVSKV